VGSRFWFTVRFGRSATVETAADAGAPVANADGAAPSQAAVPHRRLLMAEDNVVNQRVAARMLEKMGYLVDVVNDGREAVAAWARGGYDAILMDCQMPEMDGYAATREIRRQENGAARIPIIALTAHAIKGADEECFAAGMDHYLTKPFDRDDLRKCLERSLEHTARTAA
jgi:two-component system, sensor histidine kinase and response regulator